jgi:hypothetical protein
MCTIACAVLPATASAQGAGGVEIRVVLDEAEAALAILEARLRGDEPDDAAWTRLTSSEAYRRHKQRQESFGAEDVDGRFREFLTSADPLARLASLRRAVESWRTADASAAGRRALAYLPADTEVRAAVYPMIKPAPNSFVFEPSTDPAIFVYVDPDRTVAELENVMAHELHHIELPGSRRPRHPRRGHAAGDQLVERFCRGTRGAGRRGGA